MLQYSDSILGKSLVIGCREWFQLKKKSADESQDWTFESALRELEQTVHHLEQGNLGLDQTLQEYEKAIQRIRYCQQQIETAERKIELLRGIDKEGNVKTEAFEEGSDDLLEKQSNRNRRRSV